MLFGDFDVLALEHFMDIEIYECVALFVYSILIFWIAVSMGRRYGARTPNTEHIDALAHIHAGLDTECAGTRKSKIDVHYITTNLSYEL